ncbi:MAG: DUF4272 domain-containing protein [Oscillospiraceae bacterium]|nr:DUF4272 domain-containing protein [Oscillospiraceae bacterium]
MITPEERKQKSEQKIQAKGIAIHPHLPCVESSEDVTLKEIDTICKRAIVTLLSTQIANEIHNHAYGEVKFFIDLMDKFSVKDAVNQKETKLLNGTFSEQDVVDVVWEYECCWSLFWALGFIETMEDASTICDCEKSIRLVADCKTYYEFKSKCKLRDIEEILDMLDLYYRYHWAVVEHQHINPELSIGNLNGEVVYERRRGLEWLISKQSDWHEISLDT